MKHTFDRRDEIAVRDLERGITKQPVRCLYCKKLVTDPTEDNCKGEKQ
jgi:hypothetical protein